MLPAAQIDSEPKPEPTLGDLSDKYMVTVGMVQALPPSTTQVSLLNSGSYEWPSVLVAIADLPNLRVVKLDSLTSSVPMRSGSLLSNESWLSELAHARNISQLSLSMTHHIFRRSVLKQRDSNQACL